MPIESRLRFLPHVNLTSCCYRCHPEQVFRSRTSYNPEELENMVKLFEERSQEVYRDHRIRMLDLHPDRALLGTPKRYGPAFDAL